MSTRASILDAFETLIIEQGERAATVANVAQHAGVSKGGLLYHFGSKDALLEGLAERLRDQTAEEAERLRSAATTAEQFLRESLSISHPMDRTYVALIGLAQLDEYPAAKQALQEFDEVAMDGLTEALGDAALATLVLRLSDGFYLRAALGLGEGAEHEVEAVMRHLHPLLP